MSKTALNASTVLPVLLCLATMWAVFGRGDSPAAANAEPAPRVAVETPQLPAEPGPEADGLRLMLTITNTVEGDTDRHRFRLEVLNVGRQDVTLVGPRSGTPMSYEAFFLAGLSFQTDPEVIFLGPQMGVNSVPSRAPRPEQPIAAGGSFGVEWETAGARLMPQSGDEGNPFGYALPTSGLFLVRAEAYVERSDGRFVRLESNAQRFFAGGSAERPKPPVAHVVEADEGSGTVTLDVGSASGAGVGDVYMLNRGLVVAYRLEIVEVGETESTATVTVLKDDSDSFPEWRGFPKREERARLVRE